VRVPGAVVGFNTVGLSMADCHYAETWPWFDPWNASLHLIDDPELLAEKKAEF
jgi:hypothetical protein